MDALQMMMKVFFEFPSMVVIIGAASEDERI
jgi:hypothetical protein